MRSEQEGTLPRTSVAIRDFQSEDYPAIVEIGNLVYPEHPMTVEEERFEDENFDRTKYLWRRLVAVHPDSGKVAGDATFTHIPWAFDPHRFNVWIAVHPMWQRRGIGGLLYDRVLEELRPHEPRQLRTWAQDTMTDTIAFLQQRGFRELHRSWESRLDLRTFDLARFAKYWDLPPGIEVVTLREGLARDPECVRAVYEMDCEIAPDVPRVDPFTPASFDMWREHEVAGPRAMPEAYFLAKDGDRYVGRSNLERNETLHDVLYTGFTAVRREYRGRGIAFALKLRAIDYANRHRYREIRTWNSSLNAPMLGINVTLGFVRQPAWITFGKDLAEA